MMLCHATLGRGNDRQDLSRQVPGRCGICEKTSVRIDSQSVACAVILGLFWHAADRPAEAQKPSSTNPQQEERVLLAGRKPGAE